MRKRIVQEPRKARQGTEHVRLTVHRDGSEEISVFGPAPEADPEQIAKDDAVKSYATQKMQDTAEQAKAFTGARTRGGG